MSCMWAMCCACSAQRCVSTTAVASDRGRFKICIEVCLVSIIHHSHSSVFLRERSNDLNHMYERLFEPPDDSPPWKRELAELDSTSCRNTYRCSKRFDTLDRLHTGERDCSCPRSASGRTRDWSFARAGWCIVQSSSRQPSPSAMHMVFAPAGAS